MPSGLFSPCCLYLIISSKQCFDNLNASMNKYIHLYLFFSWLTYFIRINFALPLSIPAWWLHLVVHGLLLTILMIKMIHYYLSYFDSENTQYNIHKNLQNTKSITRTSEWWVYLCLEIQLKCFFVEIFQWQWKLEGWEFNTGEVIEKQLDFTCIVSCP